MNAKRKMEMQERRIQALLQKIERLEIENNALKGENRELLDKEAKLKARFDEVEKLRREYNTCLSGMHNIRQEYTQAIFKAKQTEQEYRKRFKQLLRQIKT